MLDLAQGRYFVVNQTRDAAEPAATIPEPVAY
jgi:hypothetical protein